MNTLRNIENILYDEFPNTDRINSKNIQSKRILTTNSKIN